MHNEEIVAELLAREIDKVQRTITESQKALDLLRNTVDRLYNDRPRYFGSSARYTILEPRNENGKWIIPERIFIPKEYWGNEVSNKEIQWHDTEFDTRVKNYRF